MKKINLTQGKVALVDEEDFIILSSVRWYCVRFRGKFYAQGMIDGKPVYMHRFIVKANRRFDIDHKDGNGLNNRKSNLRACTKSQNQGNRGTASHNTSGFKGVSAHPSFKGFRAFIRKNGIQQHIGIFQTASQAAREYDKKAKELFGEFAKTNESLGLFN